MFTRQSMKFLAAAAITIAFGGVPSAFGADSAAKGQASLEVYAELTQSGVAAIAQMPNGQLIIGYHPFYVTPTSVQVATLNADHRSHAVSLLVARNDPTSRLLGDHQSGAARVATCYGRHDARVDHAQAANANDPEVTVNNSGCI
jgi:hypothetical protein